MPNDLNLLPCPSCGGAAEIYYPFHLVGKPGQPASYLGGVQCSVCRLQSPATRPPGLAVDAWNRRAQPVANPPAAQRAEPSEEELIAVGASVGLGTSLSVAFARALLARYGQPAAMEPIQLSDDVQAYLREGMESATGGEDVDHEFAHQLNILLGPIYTAGPVPKAAEWAPFMLPVAAQAQPSGNAHIDDDAVDHFAAAMKEKLAQARAKGRSGWHECDPADLSAMLREHVEKGDPRDVANFCMFLWSLGKPISAAQQDAADAARCRGLRGANADALFKALHKIAAWPDGGEHYGQEKIKRFAQDAVDAARAAMKGEGNA